MSRASWVDATSRRRTSIAWPRKACGSIICWPVLSVCAPTRCCFLTGKHSGHTSVRNNGEARSLRPEESTVASLLKTQGYATGGFGKWGCGGRGSTGVPEKHGFDVFFGYYDQQHAHSYYPPYLVRNSQEVPLDGNYGTRGETYSHYVIHEAAMRFIRENKDRAFFAYLPYTPPHGNFDIPDDDPAWQLYKDQPWPESARRYAAMVTMLDRQIGEVFALLKEFKIDDNTLVFFSGDNGANDYFKSDQYPRGIHLGNKHPSTGVEFRGKKGTLYEGGLRVPFLARWPGKIPAGSVSDHVGYFPDILPTIADVAGCQTPADIDGISILPELIGEKAAGKKQEQHDYLYWEIADWIAVRQGNWRAVKPPGDEPLGTLRPCSQTQVRRITWRPQKPELLAKLIAIAHKAHQPLQEGTYAQDRPCMSGTEGRNLACRMSLPIRSQRPRQKTRRKRSPSKDATHLSRSEARDATGRVAITCVTRAVA